jgi:hypothetical protein
MYHTAVSIIMFLFKLLCDCNKSIVTSVSIVVWKRPFHCYMDMFFSLLRYRGILICDNIDHWFNVQSHCLYNSKHKCLLKVNISIITTSIINVKEIGLHACIPYH